MSTNVLIAELNLMLFINHLPVYKVKTVPNVILIKVQIHFPYLDRQFIPMFINPKESILIRMTFCNDIVQIFV